MATFTTEYTELTLEIEEAQQHRVEAGGMLIALESWKAGLDTGEAFAELPDSACQEGHFGYVLAGSATVRYNDGGTETHCVGAAHYLRPGHDVHVEEDLELSS